mgnify:CR=1 FL=1
MAKSLSLRASEANTRPLLAFLPRPQVLSRYLNRTEDSSPCVRIAGNVLGALSCDFPALTTHSARIGWLACQCSPDSRASP